jgi:hypothetical protein
VKSLAPIRALAANSGENKNFFMGV